jgi:predicted nucleic acid-binding protein
VLIPEAVEEELRRSHPILPVWLHALPARDREKTRRYMETVDRGEAEAIVLAEEVKADHLLMDERKGRRLARQRGLPSLDCWAWS